jgi:hypothetical protein
LSRARGIIDNSCDNNTERKRGGKNRPLSHNLEDFRYQMCCMEISILLLDNMKEEVSFTIALV